MQSRLILDEQLSASSVFNGLTGAAKARLALLGTWNPSLSDASPWLQVDLIKNATLSRISTQGSKYFDRWVESYNVTFSYDGTNFQFCKQYGEVKVGK